MKNLRSIFTFNKNDYWKVENDVWVENWHGLRFFSCIGLIAFGLMAVVSVLSSSIERNLPLYIGYGFLSLAFWGISHGNIQSNRGKALIVYSFFSVLLSFGVVMGTILFPEDLTVSYIVMMIAVPLLFTARASVLNGLVLVSMCIYIGIAYHTQQRQIFIYNLLDVVPYGILSMFATAAIMRNKLQRILYEKTVVSLKDSERESQARIRNYESFITDMVRYASSEERPNQVLNQLVQYIGQRLGSDRAYIFEENTRGTFDNTYEWCKEGISREKERLQDVPFEGTLEIWIQQFQKSENIIIPDLNNYRKVSQAIYDYLKPQGVNTLVAGPIKASGKIIGFLGVDNPPQENLHDISDLLKMMEFMISFMIRLRENADALERSALYDQLTDCQNRKALDWAYSEKIYQCKTLAVAMCDLNGLKEINDQQGHDAGDKVILQTAEILKSVFGKDHVYRIGGDEFIAVLPDISQVAFMERIALASSQLGTAASIGTAFKDTMDMDFEGILKIADGEMYEKKNQYYFSTGKDRRKQSL